MKPLQYICIPAALLLAHGALAGIVIDETRDMDADGVIDIEITNGIITLTGQDNDQFHIAGELSDAAEGFDLRVVNGGIRFEEEIDRPSRFGCFGFGDCRNGDNLSILDIVVPRNSVIRFEGVNTEVRASGLRGNTQLEVINGEIILSDLSGVIRVETVNGDIDADSLDGRVTLETVNGRIEDRDSRGNRFDLSTVNGSITTNTRSPRVTAETVNGDIELDLGGIDELELSTVGGRLEVSAALNDLATIDLSSVGGRIDLSLPENTSARFRVSTAVGGRITNQLSDDEPVRENRYVNSSELNFSLNGGNGDVHISTVNGNVTLRGR